MVRTHVTANFNLLVLVSEVETGLLWCHETAATSTEATATAIRETLVIHIVGCEHKSVLRNIVIVVCCVAEEITVLCTVARIGI